MNEVRKYLDSLLKEKDVLVVGVSGGPDSMVLLDVLNEYKEKKDLTIIAAHVNHNVRKDCDFDENIVKEYAENHNIIFESMKIEETIDNNFEMEARKIRYDFFKQLIHKYNAKYLFTAHHGDDLMETILMRLSRGSVLKGYKGITTETNKKDYKIIRPLLWVTKDDILEYADNKKIKYALDYTNDEDEHTRNRFRHNVIPFLKSENENCHLKYKQFSDELLLYDNFIDEYLIKSNILKDNKIDIELFNKENILIKTKLIQKLLNDIYDGYLEIINKQHVNNIIDLIEKNKSNNTINLPDNYIGIINYGKFEIIKNKNTMEINELFDDDITINNQEFKYIDNSDEKSNYVIRLNSDEIKLPLHIRSRKTGDKISVKNLNGTKKVSDVLTNEKVNFEDRIDTLLLCDSDDEVLWIPGIKKSKFDKEICEKYDIIIKYISHKEAK